MQHSPLVAQVSRLNSLRQEQGSTENVYKEGYLEHVLLKAQIHHHHRLPPCLTPILKTCLTLEKFGPFPYHITFRRRIKSYSKCLIQIQFSRLLPSSAFSWSASHFPGIWKVR